MNIHALPKTHRVSTKSHCRMNRAQFTFVLTTVLWFSTLVFLFHYYVAPVAWRILSEPPFVPREL